MSGSVATASTATAGEAGDDDIEEGDDAVDDGGQHSPDAVDDGHQAVADSAEDGFELEFEEVSGWISWVSVCGSWFGASVGELTQDTTAPILTKLEWEEAELGCWLRCCRSN